MRAVATAIVLASNLALAQQPAPPMSNGGLPTASPKGTQIAFTSKRDGQQDIYVVNADGTGLARLTQSPEREGAAGWTADGKEVLFTVGTMDTTRLYAISPTGSGQRLVATLAGRGPTISNSGQWMAYSAGRMPLATLTVSAVDGSNARTLTDGKMAAFNVAWSPDDRQLAYTLLSMDTDRTINVWVASADGTNARQLTRIQPDEGGPQWPAWSRDGKRVAVQVGKYDRNNRANNTAHIWVLDIATGGATKLAAHDRPYLDETPTWLPDGRIAFQSDRTGRMEIWIMNADGTGARQVTK